MSISELDLPNFRRRCLAARGLLQWTQAQLANAANVSRATVVEFEAGERTLHLNNLASIQRAFEKAGIEFPETGLVDLHEDISMAGMMIDPRMPTGSRAIYPRRS